MSTEEQSGNWNLIGKKNEADSGYVFKAWIDHGSQPVDSSYFYRIVPGISSSEIAAFVSDTVEVLKNTPDLQAVKQGDLAGIVFYPPSDPNVAFTPDSVETGNGLWLSTDQPCALLFDESSFEVCISSPSRNYDVINLKVSHNINGGHQEVEIPFTMPGGEWEGTSTCKNIYAVSGSITTHCANSSAPGIPDVQLHPTEPVTYTLGAYTVSNLQIGYTLDPYKNTDHDNGVTTLDVFLIASHILQVDTFDSPYKIIAADVTDNGLVDTFDIFHITEVILQIVDTFSNVDSWEFVDASYTFPYPGNPWFENFPETIEMNNLNLINGSKDFYGIKMGDVNCSAINQFLKPCEEEEVNILVEDKALRAEEIFTVALQVENFEDIAAYQFALDFDPQKLEYRGLQSGDLKKGANAKNFGFSGVNNREIRTLWLQNDATDPAYTVMDTTLTDSSSLFLIEFEALVDIAALSDIIELKDDFSAVAIPSSGDCGRQINLQFIPAVETRSNKNQLNPNDLTTNARVRPNPTSAELLFEISVKEDAVNTIFIFDAAGKEVLRQKVDLVKGQNRVELENISSWQDGLYYFTITDSAGLSTNGKFVKN